MLKTQQFALASLALVSWTIVSLACGGKVLEGGGGSGGSSGSTSEESYTESEYSTEWTEPYSSDTYGSTDTYYSSDTYYSTYDTSDYSDTESDSYYSESCWSSDDSYGCYGSSDSYYTDTYASDSSNSSDWDSSDTEGCIDFQLTEAEVVCTHNTDCASVNTGILCPGECLCGGTPANQGAVAALQALTASFPPVGCSCPSFGQPVCVSGRCQVVLPP